MKRTVFLALALGLSACGGESVDKAARAREEIARMELAAAKVDLMAALAEKGDSRDLLVMLAGVQLRMGDGIGASASAARLERLGMKGDELARLKAEAALLRGSIEQGLELLGDDPSPQAWRLRAAAHLARGRTAAAIEAFARGEAAGDDVLLLRDHAMFLLGADDVAGAAQRAQAMARIAPAHYDTLMVGGEVAVRRRRFDEAQKLFAEAARLFPNVPEPWLASASAYEDAGELDRAARMVAKAAALVPNDARVVAFKVRVAAGKQDWQTVRSLLARQEGSLDPLSANGLAYAEALLFLGQREQARAMFQRAFLRAPGNPRVRLMMAGAQMATGDPAAAYQTVRPLAESLIADDPELELAEAAARALDRDAEADEWKAKRLSPQRAVALDLAAKAAEAAEREDWPTAVALYRQLVGMGQDGEVYRRLALALSRAGKADEAIAAADRAR
ncbi:MAG: tetratricopeptide repeat protein, partial [Novosphingobium meiothermophilum]